jgi:hypothetical protein
LEAIQVDANNLDSNWHYRTNRYHDLAEQHWGVFD